MPLNALGKQQGSVVGKILKGLLPLTYAVDYVSSPLERACNTMEIVRRELEIPETEYRVDDRLREIQHGNWEGMSWEEIEHTYPEKLKERNNNHWDFSPPEGGENYEMLYQRVSAFLKSLKKDTVIVSHGGIARVLLVALCNAPKQKAAIENIYQEKILLFKNGNVLWV